MILFISVLIFNLFFIFVRFYFLIFILFQWSIFRERVRQTERDLQFTGSFSKCLQNPNLACPKPGAELFSRSHTWVCRPQYFGHLLIVSQRVRRELDCKWSNQDTNLSPYEIPTQQAET